MSTQARRRAQADIATPVRSALEEASTLQSRVMDGLAALLRSDLALIEEAIRPECADSLDLDAAMKAGRENENRWDYLIGYQDRVIAVEPHSARGGEIDTVIRKKRNALLQLRGHLRESVKVANWLWVGRDVVRFADTSKAKLRLAQNGFTFVGKRVLRKHLA